MTKSEVVTKQYVVAYKHNKNLQNAKVKVKAGISKTIRTLETKLHFQV